MDLGAGLELRGARPADVDQVAELLAQRGDPADAEDLRLVVDDPDAGLEACAVVVEGDRVVATASLLDEVLVLAGVEIPAGQVELVATHEAYEGRGLARALMGWCHARSKARGQLAQVMIGIPNFYRQFGYGYAIPMHPCRTLERIPSRPPEFVVREATAEDIPAMAALQASEQDGFELRMPHSSACWRWLVERSGSLQWVAELDGVVLGSARLLPPGEGHAIGELAASESGAALALVAETATDGTEGLVVQARPGGVAGRAVAPYLGEVVEAEWYYARVQDLPSLLEHLAPVLVQRLRDAGLADREHEVLLSTWRSHLRFTVGPGGVTGMTAGGPEQAPVSKGGSGLPADAVPALVFGPYGALGLEERLPDCLLGRQRDLMASLFPPVHGDLLTFYLPI